MIPWIVEHCADLVNKLQVGQDGRTAFERLKGKCYRGEMLPICSDVMLRVSGKVHGGILAERWFESLWLGKRFHTEEHIVMKLSDGTIVRTRSVQCMPQKLDQAMVAKIEGTPWAPMGVTKQEEDVHRPIVREIDYPEINHGGLQPRSAKITSGIVARYGASEKCAKCRAMQRGDFSQPALGHSKECRTRIENLMREDPEMKDRLDRAEERKNRYIAERVEQAVTHQEPEAAPSSSSSPAGLSTPVSVHPEVEPMEVEKAKGDASEPPSKRRREDETKDTMDTGEIPIPQAETEGDIDPNTAGSDSRGRERSGNRNAERSHHQLEYGSRLSLILFIPSQKETRRVSKTSLRAQVGIFMIG